MGAGFGFFLHHGWLYSCVIGHRDCDGLAQTYQWRISGVIHVPRTTHSIPNVGRFETRLTIRSLPRPFAGEDSGEGNGLYQFHVLGLVSRHAH